MSEDMMTADLLDLLDCEPEGEEVFTERPELAALNLKVVRVRETVTLTAEWFKQSGDGYERPDFEKAQKEADLAVKLAAEAVRTDDKITATHANLSADYALAALGDCAVEVKLEAAHNGAYAAR